MHICHVHAHLNEQWRLSVACTPATKQAQLHTPDMHKLDDAVVVDAIDAPTHTATSLAGCMTIRASHAFTNAYS